MRHLFIILVTIWPTLCTAQVDSNRSLFVSEDLLEFKLVGNVQSLLKDRVNEPSYFDFQLKLAQGDTARRSLTIKIKTRGHFRRQKGNCDYPPLLLNFEQAMANNTAFESQRKLKLVTPCRDQKYVIREYLVYKLYNLLTTGSFKARLVKFTLVDLADSKKEIEPLYGILLEDEDAMAKRNSSVLIEGKILKPQQILKENFFMLSVFQYMIGNTDWSIQYQQNIKLLSLDSVTLPIAVPYDFDHAGIVAAPYAQPAPELNLNSTRERRYRGYCVQDMTQFDQTISKFNQLRERFYEVYNNETLIDDSYKKSTINFLTSFYKTINDPKSLKREFQYPCNPEGTGNVVIKGLKN